MKFSERYSTEDLHNHAEDLVFEQIEKSLEDYGAPEEAYTQEAVLDIAALALNQIPPLYRVTLLGRLYETEFKEKYGDQIEKAVARAIRKVLKDS